MSFEDDTVIIQLRRQSRYGRFLLLGLCTCLGFGMGGAFVAYGDRSAPVPVPAETPSEEAADTAPREHANAEPAEPVITEETEPVIAEEPEPQPMPPRAARALRQGRHQRALSKLDREAPEYQTWREEIRRAWLRRIERISESGDADELLDAASAYRAHWPTDRTVLRLESGARARQVKAIERFERELSGDDLKTRVRLKSSRARTYDIHFDWAPDQETRIAAVADPAKAGLSILLDFVAIVGNRTGSCGFKTDTAEIHVAGTAQGWTMPTRCAREIVRAKANPEKMVELIGRCIKPTQFSK
jgi:hypothetical protein